MKEKKVSSKNFLLILTVILILIFSACDEENNNKNETAITYTVSQTGGTANIADTTGLIFTFSSSINALNVTASNITLAGTAEKGSATFTGTGLNWTLSPITVNSAGSLTVSITKEGITKTTQSVSIHKAVTGTENCQVCWTVPCSCQGHTTECQVCWTIPCSCQTINKQCPTTGYPKECDCPPPLSNEELAEMFRQFAAECGLGMCGTDHVQETINVGFEQGTSAFNNMARSRVLTCLQNWAQTNLFLQGKNVTATGEMEQVIETGRVDRVDLQNINVWDRPVNWNSINPTAQHPLRSTDGVRSIHDINFARVEREQL